MRRHLLTRASVLLLASVLCGCSALIDTSPYVQQSDGGREDRNVPLDAPTTPLVRISPESPFGDDDLLVVIDVESTDPLNVGPVGYEYRWQRDGADADLVENQVPASETRRDERWTVEVTPVSSDGSRRGAPAMAEVTIGNTPPVLSGLGLDSYRPILGETLVALSAGTSDADGDPVTLHYEWLRNGALLDDQSTNRLDTSRVTLEPGDRIVVRAIPRDSSAEGEPVTAGPAVILSDTTRWRQILPDRDTGRPTVVMYDPPNRRALYAVPQNADFGDVQLWEYALDESGTGGRFIQLFPTGGDPPLVFARTVYDARNRRILMFGAQGDIDSGGVTSDVWALDVSQRGQESWSVVASDGPAPRFIPSVAVDEERNRVLMYGGINLVTGDAFNDLWSFDVGSNTWTEHVVSMPPLAVLVPGLVVDPTRDRALLIGGGEASSPGAPPTPSLAIYTLDLAREGAGFERAGSSLSRPVLFPLVGVDLARDRALLAFGRGVEDESSYRDAIAIDLDTLLPTVVTPTGTGPESGGLGFFELDARRGDFVIFPGSTFGDSGAGFELYRWSGAAEISPVHRTGVDAPGALAGALAVGEYGFTLYGGMNHDRVHEEVWQLGSSGSFSRVSTSPDALTGRTPGPRAGVSLQSGSVYGPELQFFGGRVSTSGTIADSQMWVLRDNRWVEQTLASGAPPPVREGAAFFIPACGGWRSGFFGGTRGATYYDDAGFFDCVDGDRECQWTNPAGAPRPPARAYATAARFNDDSRVIVYGGEDSGQVFDDLWTLFTCGGDAQPWQQASATGTPPPGRTRHSMTLLRVERGELEQILVFGGSTRAGGFGGTFLSDVHRLVRLASTTVRWETVDVASGPNDARIPGRHSHAALWDERGARLLVYGGMRQGSVGSDFWELRIR